MSDYPFNPETGEDWEDTLVRYQKMVDILEKELAEAREEIDKHNKYALQNAELNEKAWAEAESDYNKVKGENAALTAELEQTKNDLLDALDVKTGKGPTALSIVTSERDALRDWLNTKAQHTWYCTVQLQGGECNCGLAKLIGEGK